MAKTKVVKKVAKKVAKDAPKKVSKEVTGTPRYTIVTKVIDNIRGTTTIKREFVDKV